jgi:hypothetical protein
MGLFTGKKMSDPDYNIVEEIMMMFIGWGCLIGVAGTTIIGGIIYLIIRALT